MSIHLLCVFVYPAMLSPPNVSASREDISFTAGTYAIGATVFRLVIICCLIENFYLVILIMVINQKKEMLIIISVVAPK